MRRGPTPFIANGDNLLLNLAVRDGGQARVAILDENSKPIPNLGLQDCAPLRVDAVDQVVSWNSCTGLRELANQRVQLRFLMNDTQLYSFRLDC